MNSVYAKAARVVRGAAMVMCALGVGGWPVGANALVKRMDIPNRTIVSAQLETDTFTAVEWARVSAVGIPVIGGTDVGTCVAGQVLVVNGAGTAWECGAPGVGAVSFATAYAGGRTWTFTGALGGITGTDGATSAADDISLLLSTAKGAGTTTNAFNVTSSGAHNATATTVGYRYTSTSVSGTNEGARYTMQAGTENAIHVVLGDILMDSGDVTLTSGNLTLTSGAFTQTTGDMSIADGSLTLVDADNAATLSVTNDTATTASPVQFLGSGVFTGTGTTAFVSIEPTGLTTGHALDVLANALTTGVLIRAEASGGPAAGGFYLALNDGATNEFTVADDGATIIEGSAAGTDALTLSAGDILLTAGDLDLANGEITVVQATVGENALTVASTGGVARNAPLVVVTEVDDGSGAGSDDETFDVNVTGAKDSSVVDVDVSAAGAAAADVLNFAWTVGAHTGDPLDVSYGTNLTGSLRLTSAGARAAGAALAELVLGHTSDGEGIAFTHANSPTGDDISSNMTNAAVGAQFVAVTDDRAFTAPLHDYDLSGAFVGADANLFDVNVLGNAVGSASGDLFHARFTAGVNNFAGDVFDADMTNANVAATPVRIANGARALSSPLILATLDGAPAAGGPAVHLDLDGSTANGHGLDLDVGGNGAFNVIQIARTAGAFAGDAVNVAMASMAVTAQTWVSTDNRLFTSIPYSQTFSGAFATAAVPAVQYTFSGAHTTTGIDIVETSTASGSALAVRNAGAAYAGSLVAVNLDASADPAALALNVERLDNNGTSNLASVVDNNAGAAVTGRALFVSQTADQAAPETIFFRRTMGALSNGMNVLDVQATTNAAASRPRAVSALLDNAAGGDEGIGTAAAYTATVNGNAADSAVTRVYAAYDAGNFTDNGGTSTGNAVMVGTGWDNALNVMSGNILFSGAGSTVDWTGAIAAGLRFTAGQSLTIDANVVAPGTDTAVIDTDATSIRLTGALRPTKTLYVPAKAFVADGLDGLASATYADFGHWATAGGVYIPVLDFDGAGVATEFADVEFSLPWDYVAATNVTVRIVWGQSAGAPGGTTVQFGAGVLSVADGEALTAALAAAVLTATAAPAQNARVTTDIVLAGATFAAGETLILQVSRNAAADTWGADARVFGAEIRYTSDTP